MAKPTLNMIRNTSTVVRRRQAAQKHETVGARYRRCATKAMPDIDQEATLRCPNNTDMPKAQAAKSEEPPMQLLSLSPRPILARHDFRRGDLCLSGSRGVWRSGEPRRRNNKHTEVSAPPSPAYVHCRHGSRDVDCPDKKAARQSFWFKV